MAYVKQEKHGHVMLLTMDRPEVLNATDDDAFEELIAVTEQIDGDDDIYVVILTGAGRAFLAGGDIAYMRELNATRGLRNSSLGQRAFNSFGRMKKPVIAAINGWALGGGCELALACDIRIASEKARFGCPEAGLGIMTGSSGTQRLPRTLGVSKAIELIGTGRIFKADEALRIGLVSYVYPHEELMDRAMELAEQICANAPIAVQQCKMAILSGYDIPIEVACKLEVEANAVCFGTEDKMEGMGAFLEKRTQKQFLGK
jgi:enoyl-CoA hydratase